jgi:ribosome recycling factor
VNSVVRAIQESDLALTPNTDGVTIRLNIPTLTADRRKDLVKMVKNMAEESRVAVRNVRRDVIQDLKDLKKEGEISEDDEHRAEEEVQKLTDSFIEKINDILHHKEQEILEI